jgi:hypothetical protein
MYAKNKNKTKEKEINVDLRRNERWPWLQSSRLQKRDLLRPAECVQSYLDLSQKTKSR